MATIVALAMSDPDDDFEAEEIVIVRTFIAGPPSTVPPSTVPPDEDGDEFYSDEIVIERTLDADGNTWSEETEG